MICFEIVYFGFLGVCILDLDCIVIFSWIDCCLVLCLLFGLLHDWFAVFEAFVFVVLCMLGLVVIVTLL